MNYMNYVINDLELLREFDLSNYVFNARYMIEGKHDIIKNDINLSSYKRTLSELVNSVETLVTVNPDVLAFFGSCNKNLFNLNDKISSIVPPDVMDIKPQYIAGYVNTIGSLINDTIKGVDTKDRVDELSDISSLFKLKKQMVKTSLSYDTNHLTNSEFSIATAPKVTLNSDYVQKAIIPFLKTVETMSEPLIKNIADTNSVISECEKNIGAYNATIVNITKREGLESDVIRRINYVTYNCYRTLIELVSFLTAMVSRKVSYYIQYGNMCLGIRKRIESVMSNNPVIEGASETVLPEDNHNLAEDLQQGRADAYESIANNIYEYNTGILMNSPESPMRILGNSVGQSIDTSVDATDYDREDYNETNKMFGIISRGLDIISQYSDDYLMVFDDLIEKAGFQLNLEDRFRGLLAGLDDIEEYTSAANIPTVSTNIYFKMLSEVKDYGNNMTDIAKNIYDCHMKIEALTDRFNNNINGEYANAEAINELKVFFEDFVMQFDKLVNIVAGKFMMRLKSINIAIEVLNNKRIENNDINDDFCENTNFNTTTVDDIISEYTALTDAMFEDFAREYTVAKEMKLRGCKIVFEADAPAPAQNQTTTTTTQQPANATTTTQTTQTTIKNATGNNGFKQTLLNQLSQWFEQLSNKLKDVLSSQMAKNDQAYIQKFKNELLNKDYTNLSTQQPIYNYETLLPFNTITTDIIGLTNRVNSGIAQKLNTANNNDDIIKILFPSTPPISVFNADKMADAITQYYKVGNNTGSQPMNFSGDLLKTVVTNAVNYCENFYSNFLPSIQNNIKAINDNFKTVVSSVIQESGYDESFGFLFTEEEAANANGQAKDVNNMNDKIKKMQNYITQYCNAVLTAVFDREKDYIALLRTFVNESSNT